MILHGHLIPVTDENRPPDHVFEGLTRSCACSKCGGRYGASWHVQMVEAPQDYRAGRYFDAQRLGEEDDYR